MAENNIHSGHRQRMRDRINKNGAKSLADHELLEVLLFYCIPQKNTNPIAHKLIAEYGSLTAIFTTDSSIIGNSPNLTEYSATLFKVIMEIQRRIKTSIWEDRVVLDSSEIVGKFALDLLGFENEEVFVVLCLDAKNRLIHTCELVRGSAVSISINFRSIVEAAIKYKAASVILIHNHPGGEAFPTTEDEILTVRITKSMEDIDVFVIDHVIVNNKDYFSMADNSLIINNN